MAERYLEIKNFRNIGIKEPQRLLLGTTLKKENLGGVVYVVGPNNSGKSNCLDALEKFGNNGLTKSDVSDFDDNDPIPELRFVAWENHATYEQVKSLSMQNNVDRFKAKDIRIKDLIDESEKPEEINEQTRTFAHKFLKGLKTSGFFNNVNNQIYRNLIDEYLQDPSKIPTGEAFWSNIISKINRVNSRALDSFYSNYCGVDAVTAETFMNRLKFGEKSTTQKECENFEKIYGFKLIPNIIRFKPIEIMQKQFNVESSQIKQSPFLVNLLESIDYNIDNLVNSYAKYKEKSVRAKLEATQNEINLKLEKIADKFNKLYFFEKNKYIFKIYLDTNLICFSILLNDLPLNFDTQSTGFKWFFNFYFTLVSQKNISVGDIIIMDEPATNLHVRGIEELRDFIKEYATRTKLTFIISTHSPFFIDVNHLEQVRVVSRVDNESIIINKFNIIEEDDTDSLAPIKSALTVGRHILLDPSKKTIFVEGITDYCYLTYFKKHNKVAQDIVFLPIQGVKKSDKDLFSHLLKIEKYPTLLVDGDYAGLECQKRANSRYKDRIEVISLKDIDSSFLTIEDLFAPEDKPQSKDFDSCVDFKSSMVYSKLSAKTKSNFTKLLENISA